VPTLSVFGQILQQMVEETPGAHGAIFADWEGEPIDQYSRGPTLDFQITGAQWGVVLAQAHAAMSRAAGRVGSMLISCERVLVFIRPVREQYFIVLQTSPGAHVAKTLQYLDSAANRISVEM
jgi:predicted regulator of Ras-like GTPase activity (Roadblock/LC7/MglB family)